MGNPLALTANQQGRRYPRKARAQVKLHRSETELDQVIAGEYPVGVQILNHHVAYSVARGAPIGWQSMNPSLASLLAVGLLKGPHTNAAKLLIDFIMSDEGQNVLRNADYIPVAPNVKPKDSSLRPDVGKFKALFLPPETMDENTPNFMKIYIDTLR